MGGLISSAHFNFSRYLSEVKLEFIILSAHWYVLSPNSVINSDIISLIVQLFLLSRGRGWTQSEKVMHSIVPYFVFSIGYWLFSQTLDQPKKLSIASMTS
jgi:hypothetical protein